MTTHSLCGCGLFKLDVFEMIFFVLFVVISFGNLKEDMLGSKSLDLYFGTRHMI